MADLTSQSRSSAWRWPLLVVCLLAAHVAAMMTAVVVINRRTPTLGVVENYYDRAVNWDRQLAVVRASKELGWQVKVETGAVVRFTLTDAAGRPIKGATLDVTAIHAAHSETPVKATFAASDDGIFGGELSMKHEGFYDFTVTARVGETVFVTTVTQWVSREGNSL